MIATCYQLQRNLSHLKCTNTYVEHLPIKQLRSANYGNKIFVTGFDNSWLERTQ